MKLKKNKILTFSVTFCFLQIRRKITKPKKGNGKKHFFFVWKIWKCYIERPMFFKGASATYLNMSWRCWQRITVTDRRPTCLRLQISSACCFSWFLRLLLYVMWVLVCISSCGILCQNCVLVFLRDFTALVLNSQQKVCWFLL